MRTHFTRKLYFRVAHKCAGCSDRSSCPWIKQKCPIGAFLFYLGCARCAIREQSITTILSRLDKKLIKPRINWDYPICISCFYRFLPLPKNNVQLHRYNINMHTLMLICQKASKFALLRVGIFILWALPSKIHTYHISVYIKGLKHILRVFTARFFHL